MIARASVITTCLFFAGCGCDYSSYVGDGRLIDHGRFAGHRYVLELESLPLDGNGSRRFRLNGLPSERFVFGFELDLSLAEQRDNRFILPGDPVAELTLHDSEGREVFSRKARLSEWTWSYGRVGTEVFVYGRNESTPVLATELQADPAETYVLTVSIANDAPQGAPVIAALVAKTGGWK